jgi:thymus-specific serine protease
MFHLLFLVGPPPPPPSSSPLRTVLQWYNSTRVSPGPWVVIGCSYSGALSAWFRAKYPDLVVASVAPSGPVLAQANYSSYLGLFSEVAPQPCVQATIQAVAQIQTMLGTSMGQNELEKKFNSCNRLTEENHFYFLWSISQALGGSDQMDNPPSWPLNSTCETMTSSNDVVGNWGKLFSHTTCNSFSEKEFIDVARVVVPNSNRAW